MTTFPLPVDRTSGSPIHRQIYEGLRQAILPGRLRPGQRLPSTRCFSRELGVSRLPVLTAYDQLLHEGYFSAKIGSGTFVSDALPDDLFLSSPGRPAGPPARPRDRFQPPPPPGSRLGPFQVGIPALDRFPHAEWAGLVARHARGLTLAQLSYGDPAGWPALRGAVADHLRTTRAVRCEAEQVVIVSGSQAALRLAASVLLSPGDGVAIEEPGYFGAQRAFEAARCRLVPVPVDEEGLSIASLHRRGRRLGAVYVTPSHQFPLGVSMSAGRRFALLDWAVRHDAWVLEDDYDSEFRYVSRPLGSLQGMDTHGRVIYLGTFSKALFPAMRVGYLVLPPPLCDRFVEARRAFDFFPPSLLQLALAEFLDAGGLARHLRRMRGIYQERRDALLAGLRRHCARVLTVHDADAGLHVTAFLADGADDGIVLRRMEERGLVARALSACYIGAARRPGLLLGFGTATAQQLLEATRVLGEVLREPGAIAAAHRADR
jgi:GntR family transcriptional regulator/MocR family aminotransferase